ncbi:hypothetical protein [Tepidiforma sp.]|uniref:hypothetical protein n=1 Tax=Tepidiforma sp. TaxID=2682230 RepID=UPI002ADE0B60|nr:hypothetical protein [Tepidiforma sp.]
MIHRLLRPHRRWHRLVTDAVSGELSPLAAPRLQQHLAGCIACRRRFEEEQALRRALRALPLLSPARSLRLDPAQLASQQPAPAPRRTLPPAIVYGVRGLAAASLLLFAIVTVATLTSDADEGHISSAARDTSAGPTLMSTEAPEAGALSAPEAAPTERPAAPTPQAGVASPPTGGAFGAGATEAPELVPAAPEPETKAAPPPDAAAPGSPSEHTGGSATGNEAPVATTAAGSPAPANESRPPRSLLAAGAFALAALLALGAVEMTRRRKT